MSNNIFQEYLGTSTFSALVAMRNAIYYMEKAPKDPEFHFVNFDRDFVVNRLKRNITEILEAMPPLPEWACAYNLFEIRTGAVLATRDGRRHGNATIINEVEQNGDTYYVVATDVGNIMYSNAKEILSGFYPSQYIRSEASMEELLALVDKKRSQVDGCENLITPKE